MLGERLKNLREECGYTQKDMAKLFNITTSAYGYYEQGRNEPSIETLKHISNTFSVSTDYLLGLSNRFEKCTFYKTTDALILSSEEIKTIQLLKQYSLLDELAANPSNHVNRLHRCWQFIKYEIKNN